MFFAGYFVLVMAEALWLTFGPAWFQSAREWAAMHAPYTVERALLASVVGFTVAWKVDQGSRGAWVIAVTWSALLSVAGTLLLIVSLFSDSQSMLRRLAYSHPAEAVVGFIQVCFMAASVALLCTHEARKWILRRAEETA